MKQIVRTGGGGGGGWRTPTEDEVEVVEILLSLPKLCAKSELIRRYSFNWGRKKKRSVLDSKSGSLPSPLTQPRIDEGVTENVTAVEADKSPSTPLCFLPSGSGSDGVDNRKPPSSSVRKVLKRKATDDLIEVYGRMQQEREILMKKLKAMETLHKELTSQNLELKARGQKINYPRNMEDFNIWKNSSMKVIDQQRCHQQITMFTPATPQYYHQQLVVDPNNGKLVALSCSSNSNGGGRFGIFNHIDPRVKIHGETYDFMASSQPLDQSKYLMMDNDLRASTAAAARKRRILRMKENKNSLLAMKLSGACR